MQSGSLCVSCLMSARDSSFQHCLATWVRRPNERLIMKNKSLMLVLLFLMPGALMAQQPAASQAPQASVSPLTSKDLPEFPGKEVLMITVDYPPGSVDPIHRHNAHAFIYVLEGSIIMQVKGGKEVTLTPGQ